MKMQREQEIRGLQSPADGNPVVKSTKQKQIEYLKQIKFNGFSSTQSQSINNQGGLIVGAERQVRLDTIKEADIVRDLLFVFQGIEGKLIQFSFAEDAFILQH